MTYYEHIVMLSTLHFTCGGLKQKLKPITL